MTDQGVVRLLETAMQAQREGRAAQAEVLLLRALEAGPDEPVVLNSLGVHWLAEGRARDAQPLFERAVSIDTQAPPLWMNLAKACRLQGDDAGERRALDAVLAIDQRLPARRLARGEQIGIAARGHGRLETHHRVQLDAAPTGLALAGQATLWMAVFADMGASLIVVFNGMRLLRMFRASA